MAFSLRCRLINPRRNQLILQNPRLPGLKSDLGDLFGILQDIPLTGGTDKQRENFFEADRLKRAMGEISRSLDTATWSMEFDSASGKWTVTANVLESWLVHDGTGTVEGPFYAEAP